MAIISTFFKTRTEARNAKVDLGGKVIDNGSTAEAGKRWELQYEAAPKSEAIAAMAEVLGSEVVNVAMAEVKPRDLLGLPKNAKSHIEDRQVVLVDRKKNPIMVTYRRSKTKAMLAAHMANA